MELKETLKTVHDPQFSQQQAEMLEIIYYTDPLCCWSWAFEPQWRRLLYEFEGQIKYRYCMGGLLPGWKNYYDVVNSVSNPIQMGPVWMHASQLSGMPVQHNVWMTDPPSSSYPSCIAVKCSGLQSPAAEEAYLRLLREAIMIKGKNIAKHRVLLEVAEELHTIIPQFDINQFKEDLKNDTGLEAFRKDLQEVQSHHINRYPSLVIKNKAKQALIISGYRPYHLLMEIINKISDLEKTHTEINGEQYKDYWPSLTERELEEIT